MYTVIVRAKAKPGQQDFLVSALTETAVLSRQEDGCLNYEIFQSETDPCEVAAVETWASMQAIENHMQTPYVKTIIEKAPELCVGAPDLQIFRKLGAR